MTGGFPRGCPASPLSGPARRQARSPDAGCLPVIRLSLFRQRLGWLGSMKTTALVAESSVGYIVIDVFARAAVAGRPLTEDIAAPLPR